MKVKKNNWIIICVQILLALLSLVALYFLLPYIFQMFNIKSYVVHSESMVHLPGEQGYFETYWQENGIDPKNLIARNGINVGDLILVRKADNYGMGDVVSFITPIGRTGRTHRIYKINATAFRDIADHCLRKDKDNLTWIVIKGLALLTTDNPESVIDADQIYQAPSYERCTHTWMPLSDIEGKVVFVFPKAGLFHLFLYPINMSVKGMEEDDEIK